MKHRSSLSGFTLLELVVVLAILSIVTALAVRALDRVDDQRRYEASQRGLEEISTAILGSPDDRNAAGIRTVSGFVADLGRLPKAVGSTEYTLEELWKKPTTEPRYDLVPATSTNTNPSFEDTDVLVGVGWRGPYLHLPMGATTLLDGWGNPITSGTSYARLRDPNNQPITAEGQTIGGIHTLGANGQSNPADAGYDRDEALAFAPDQYQASLAVQIDVMNGNFPASVDPSDQIVIRVFSPDPDQPGKIKVTTPLSPLPFSANPVIFNFPVTAGLTIGPRVIRAYFTDGGVFTTSATRSTVKHVTLRPGANFVELTIDR